MLILSDDVDLHAVAMQALLRRRGADADIVDTAGFPRSLALAHRIDGSREAHLDGLPLHEYASIWWRRPQRPRVDTEAIADPVERRYAASECVEALWGALHAAGPRIYNRPERERLAAHKPYQLEVAARIGLDVPRTLITNSEEEARRFAAEQPATVYKAFGPTTLGMVDTRPLGPADAEELWRLRYAPAILQEYVPLGRELRVTVVQERVFAAEILLSDERARFDWRLDQGYRVRAVELPGELAALLRRLLAELGLDSGAIDLRETPDGRVVFLEVNPSGQFMFVDAFAGTEISEAFCDMLLGAGG